MLLACLSPGFLAFNWSGGFGTFLQVSTGTLCVSVPTRENCNKTKALTRRHTFFLGGRRRHEES